MGKVLTVDSVVTCGPSPHGGRLSMVGTSRLRVKGAFVLTKGALSAASIANCKTTSASSSNTPCLTVTSVSGGIAARLKVDSQPVVTDALAGKASGTPPGTLQVDDAKNSLLRAT